MATGKIRKWKGVEVVREKSGNLRKKEKSQGILTGCPKVKVSPLLKFNLIAVSAKMLYQEVMEDSLKSGRSQGKPGKMRVEKEFDTSGIPL